MLLNLHRLNTPNVGDLSCCPTLYFPELVTAIRMDCLGYKLGEAKSEDETNLWVPRVREAKAIIVGGGGLLGSSFFASGLKKIFYEKSKTCQTILWGAGHNKWDLGDWRDLKYKLDLDDLPFDLIGIRDDNQKYDWVPCSSCMSPLFDKYRSTPVERDIGLYVHGDTLKIPELAARLPPDIELLDNNSGFERVIIHLASSNVVLTDSYHGAYWATLLGRKVVAFPSSSKFYDLRHAVPLCSPEDWSRYLKLSIVYDDALEECRAANLEFFNRVTSLVGL